MPVEIKELVIRAVVDQGAAEPVGGEGNEPPGPAAAAPSDPGCTEEIVQACVRQVMRILRRNKER